jgi:hypothetical protein
MNETFPSLLAVVEVDKGEAVACRAPGCNHRVYRAIHVVRANGHLTVLGSTCFRTLYGNTAVAKSKPQLTPSSSRKLTPEERRELQDNTEALIQRIESEIEQEKQKLQQRAPPPASKKPRRQLFADPLAGISPEVIAEAKRNVAQRYGCDPEQAGWKGLVIIEVQALQRRNAA